MNEVNKGKKKSAAATGRAGGRRQFEEYRQGGDIGRHVTLPAWEPPKVDRLVHFQ
jgi:hypothetical protein